MERMTEELLATIEQLKEENKKLKKERDLYKARNEELNENCFGLSKENDKLKSDLSECECSMHFENDEVGYRKRECKKLKEKIERWEKCFKKGGFNPQDVGYLMGEDTLQEHKDIGEL